MVHYKKLLDGLEAKEIKLSDLLNENPEARIDSEYVLKQYLEYDALISNQPFKKINDIAFVTDGIHSSIDFDEDSNMQLCYPETNQNFKLEF